MNVDRDIEPSRPAPDRDASRDRDTECHGHRRASDAKHPRRDFSDRVDGVVRDVAAAHPSAEEQILLVGCPKGGPDVDLSGSDRVGPVRL